MKKALVSLWLVLMCSCPVCACTSFAVYFTEPIYGMNLDIPDTEITIKVEEVQGITVFSVFFLYDHMFFGRNLVMASEGQFRAVQEQYPPVQGKRSPDSAKQLYISLSKARCWGMILKVHSNGWSQRS